MLMMELVFMIQNFTKQNKFQLIIPIYPEILQDFICLNRIKFLFTDLHDT